LLNSHSQSIAKLEAQVGQIANTLNQRREGKLPSQPVANPKGQFAYTNGATCSATHEQAQAITTLRSGRTIDNKVSEENAVENELPTNPNLSKGLGASIRVPDSVTPTLETAYEPRAPFPERLRESSQLGKHGEKIQDMMEVFKQVKINIPLLDAIRQIPSYAKFLKDLCTQKRKIKSHVPKKVILTEQVSSILQHNIPPKYKDPGAPTISCIIGAHKVEKALLDLGASVNLLPYSVYLQLGLGELKPTSVALQLADRSIRRPRGIVEDVIIKVDKFYFPVDFISSRYRTCPRSQKIHSCYPRTSFLSYG
jgi:hypothetical protein